MSKETLSFTVSPSIIRHLIERQAGTLDKAILELITNGIDAGASRIDVEFVNEYKIRVRDNGRGFRTREEVEKHFGDFGFDHNTEEERALRHGAQPDLRFRAELLAYACVPHGCRYPIGQ